jgi:hypothetical protein
MTLPTSGFTTTTIKYSLHTSEGLEVSISIPAEEVASEVDEFLPYLETALNALEDAYETGTSKSMWGYRAYEGSQASQIIT